MEAFIKSFATYRTTKMVQVISSVLVVDSLDGGSSTVTVAGTGVGRENVGNWLIIDGQLFWISAVRPQKGRTALTLLPPLDAFSRPLELDEQPEGQTVGGFVAQQLQTHWTECSDAVYAAPYLTVSNSDTTPFAAPELESNGCFDLPSYCRLMRKSYRTVILFSDAGDKLACTIKKMPAASRQVSFDDGRSQLQSVDYASTGTAKLTVLCDVDTGEVDEDGNAILSRERSTWYLSADGEVSQEEPSRRAPGEWSTISVSESTDVEAKVIETFAKNKSDHKLEFWSTLDLAVQDDCTFLVYGELLQSYITFKRKSSQDSRFYYKSGELATTATEKLRGVKK